jgi:ABC-type multidrug transport system ATPase subunit
MADSSAASISIADLSVKAGSRQLLNSANANFRAGEISIIVGPSGVGKSVLLKIIAGLIKAGNEGIEVSGKVLCDGQPVQSGQTGVVFQSFALFDELTPSGNLDFAKSCGQTQRTREELEGLLDELKVPSNVPTSRLSGGQRQRLAIARTLAYDPPAILYDEPTSGLDPSTGTQVANLIRETHELHHKTSIVVTHDYPALLPIADRVFLFDPVAGKIDEVPEEKWQTLGGMLEPLSSAAVKDQAATRPETITEKAKRWSEAFFKGTTKALEALGIGLVSLVPTWRNVRWGFKFLLHYAKLVAGPTAMVYLAIAGVIVGFVTTYFAFEFLPFATYTEPLLVEDLLGAMGFAIYRIFVPVLATVLIAARSGAAVTADVGGRQYGNQIDAMTSFGASPRSYLLTPIMLVFLVGTPFLTLISFYTAKVVSLLAFAWTHPDHGPDFWHYHFHTQLRVLGYTFYFGSEWLISKLLCCGLAIGMVSYYQGISPKFSTTDVSRGVTRTILWSTLLVLAIHFAFAFFEFETFRPNVEL